MRECGREATRRIGTLGSDPARLSHGPRRALPAHRQFTAGLAGGCPVAGRSNRDRLAAVRIRSAAGFDWPDNSYVGKDAGAGASIAGGLHGLARLMVLATHIQPSPSPDQPHEER